MMPAAPPSLSGDLLMIDVPSDAPDISCCSSLIDLLEEGLRSPIKRRNLLGDRDLIRQLLNSIPTRRWLQEQACQKTDKNRAAKARSLIVELMQYSKTIWRGGDPPPDPAVYAEALSRTWKWFFEHLCSAYDPEVSSFLTWFNSKLNFVIKDVLKEIKDKAGSQIVSSSDEGGADLIERIPDRRNDDSTLINDLLSLIQSAAGEPLSRSYMRNYLYITSQRLMILILERLRYSPHIPWDQLAHELKVDQAKLLQFYRSTCRPRFQQLLREVDWL